MLLFAKAKKNNIDMTDFPMEINTNHDMKLQMPVISTASTEHNTESQMSVTMTPPIEHHKYTFTDAILSKMTRHLDDKTMLKKIRRKNGISYDVFYSKVEELKNMKC
jgi:hypothetical protein